MNIPKLSPKVYLCTTAAAATLMLSPHMASAQDAQGTQDAQEAKDTGGVGDIVVTARKRSETLQSAPVSITAITGEGMEKRGIQNFTQINNFVPNLELNNGRVDGGGSVAQLFIRGVGQDDYSIPMDPGVGLYLDGVYVSRSAAGDFGFMDVTSIEVLRGPQGTLYGKNTIGGAVKVETARPDGTLGGHLKAAYGSYNLLDFSATAQFPISDAVSAKLTGMTRSRDGYARAFSGQRLREENKSALRGAVLVNASDDLSFYVQGDYSRQRGTGSFGTIVKFWPSGTTDLVNATEAAKLTQELKLQPPFNEYGPAWVNDPSKTGKLISGDGDETKDNNNVWGASLTADWNLGAVALKSITAYRNVSIDVTRDGDHTPFHVFTVNVKEKTDQLSQEFQFTGDFFDGKFPWVFGLFGMRETGDSDFQAPLLQEAAKQGITDASLHILAKYRSDSLAAFGEGTYYFTPEFGLTLGARYTVDRKKYNYQLNRLFSGEVAIPYVKLKQSWREFLPKVGLEYKLSPDLMFYATYSKGYKAGGWNPRALVPGQTPGEFDPEYLTSFEGGFKTTLFNGDATFNAAAFYSRYKDIQLISVDTVVLPDGTQVAGTSVNNAGKGRIYGAEFELNARPISQLRLQAGMGLLKTKYLELSPAVIETGVPLSAKFIQAPEVTFNGSVEYTANFSDKVEATFHLDAAYKSKIFRTIQNYAELVTPSYWVMNGNITVTPVESNYEVQFYVTNITDEIYLVNGTDVRGLGGTEAYWSRPREWGVSAKVKF